MYNSRNRHCHYAWLTCSSREVSMYWKRRGGNNPTARCSTLSSSIPILKMSVSGKVFSPDHISIIEGDQPSVPVDLWQLALRKLDTQDATIFKDNVSDRWNILQEVLVIVQNAEKTSLEKRWKWKNRKGETIVLRDVFAKMVFWVDKLKNIGDLIIQYDPVHAALPWAAARFLLQVCSRFHLQLNSNYIGCGERRTNQRCNTRRLGVCI